MANNSQINIEVSAKDLASSVLKDVKESVVGVGTASVGSGESMTWAFAKGQIVAQALLASVRFVGDAIGKVIQTAKELAREFIQTTIELARRGGEIEDVSMGFSKQFSNANEALKDLRKSAQGTISDFDLMLSANKASMLGVTSNSKELAQLLEVARGRAQALGLDATQAFNDIVTGIGRSSPLILDNLGITTGAYQEQLRIMEKMGKTLSEEEKKRFLLKMVLDDNSRAVSTLGTLWQQFDAMLKNATDTVAIGLSPIFKDLGESVLPFVSGALEGLSTKFVEFAIGVYPKVREVLVNLKNDLTDWWLTGGSDKVKEKLENISGSISGEGGLISSFIDMIDPTNGAEGKLQEFMDTAVDSLTVALIGEDGSGGLVGSMKSLMDIVGNINADDWDNLMGFIKNVSDMMGNLNKTIDNTKSAWEALMASFGDGSKLKKIKEDTAGGGYGGGGGGAWGGDKRATGGLASGLTLVGERGAEVLDLPSGTRVHTASQSQEMTGGITININAPVTGVDHLREVITQAVDEVQSRQNSLARYNIL